MRRLRLLLYSLLYTAGLGLYLPVHLYRSLFGEKPTPDLLQRAGRLPPWAKPLPLKDDVPPRLWIHAVSVGEVNAVRPLVESLRLNADRLFVSTTTKTGQDLARRLFDERARVFYFPFDWGWTCTRFLATIRPAAVLLAETELWPNFLDRAHRSKVPVLVVNGRISDRTLRGYRRIRFFLRPLLHLVDRFCMQSRGDRDRIVELGAPPDRVHWVGNLKFDYSLPEDPGKEALVSRLGRLLRAAPEDPVWICGSTREGEEALLIRAYRTLREGFPELRLVLAPRHPHRAPEVARLLRREGLDFRLRSSLDSAAEEPCRAGSAVWILDSIGELNHLYRLADVVFIGGSLVPTGGHNVIEAAWFSKPILFGPHMENFRDISRAFLEAYGALQVKTPEELAERIRDLLRDSKAREWLGRNARKVVRDNQGAVRRTLEHVLPYLETPPGGES